MEVKQLIGAQRGPTSTAAPLKTPPEARKKQKLWVFYKFLSYFVYSTLTSARSFLIFVFSFLKSRICLIFLFKFFLLFPLDSILGITQLLFDIFSPVLASCLLIMKLFKQRVSFNFDLWENFFLMDTLNMEFLALERLILKL